MAQDSIIQWPVPPEDRVQGALYGQALQAPQVDVDPNLVKAIILHESAGDPNAVGSIGEIGLMQISPALAQDRSLKPADLRDPEINKAAGTFFLGQLLQKYNGDVERALQAYNGGPANVDAGTVSPAAKAYAQRVMNTYANLAGPREPNPAAGEVAAPDWWVAKQQSTEAPASKSSKASPISAEDWEKILQKINYSAMSPVEAPAPESFGAHLGRAYRENIAQPLTSAVQSGLEKVGEYLPENPLAIPGITVTGPAVAQNLAENFVPQTATDAALDVLGFVLPQTRIAREVAEGAGALKRILSSRPGQVAANTAVGAGMNALTGEGTAGEGAAKGFAVGTLAQVLRGIGGAAGRTATKGILGDNYSKSVAAGMRAMAPDSLGKLRTATDVFDFLGREGGEASRIARQVLSGAKAEITNRLNPGTRFRMRVFEGVDDLGKPITRTEYLTFDDADNLLSDYGRRTYTQNADPKDIYTAGHIRRLAAEEKRNLINQLEQVTPGMGKFYRKARKTYAVTDTLSQLAREPIYDLQTGQLSQKALSEQLQRGGYYEKLLAAADDPKDVDKLVSLVGRGYRGAAVDIPAQPFQVRSTSIGATHGMFPRAHPHLGTSGKPVGALPWYQRPETGIPQLLSQGIVSEFQGDRQAPQPAAMQPSAAPVPAAPPAQPTAPPPMPQSEQAPTPMPTARPTPAPQAQATSESPADRIARMRYYTNIIAQAQNQNLHPAIMAQIKQIHQSSLDPLEKAQRIAELISGR